MSQTISPATNRAYGLKKVCDVWGIARSCIYREPQKQPAKRGPKPQCDEATLLERIQKDLASSPFKGEGHRKVHARLKRQGTVSGRNRVLLVMRKNNLLSPYRSHYMPPHPHVGRIVTDAPM